MSLLQTEGFWCTKDLKITLTQEPPGASRPFETPPSYNSSDTLVAPLYTESYVVPITLGGPDTGDIDQKMNCHPVKYTAWPESVRLPLHHLHIVQEPLHKAACVLAITLDGPDAGAFGQKIG